MKASILWLALLAFTLASCKDGNEPPPEIINKLTIYGVEGEIVLAEMVDYGKLPANKNYSFDLLLHTGTTVATYEPDWIYSGAGSYFFISLWSESPDIGSGTYVIDGKVESNFSITRAVTELNVDWSTGVSDFSSYLEGYVNITNLGDYNYEITINCTDYEGNPVTAYYKGEFYYLEDK